MSCACVCTTEFIAFAKANEEFIQKNTQLIGLSIDSNPSHLAWIHTIYMTTGITIPFPVIADRMGDVSKLYGMIAPDVSNQETVRNVFFIDPEQVIRAILIYPMTNGRNVQEILRLLTALQTSDEYKVVTPANWQSGQPAMVPPPQTYNQLINRKQNPQDLGLDCKDWFWCYDIKTQLDSDSSQMVSQENASEFPSTSQNAKYNLDELISAVEDLVNRIESAKPTETREGQYNHFLTLDREIDWLEARIDMLKDQVQADHHAGNITWEEFRSIDHILESLEARLDYTEDLLKQIFGMDD